MIADFVPLVSQTEVDADLNVRLMRVYHRRQVLPSEDRMAIIDENADIKAALSMLKCMLLDDGIDASKDDLVSRTIRFLTQNDNFPVIWHLLSKVKRLIGLNSVDEVPKVALKYSTSIAKAGKISVPSGADIQAYLKGVQYDRPYLFIVPESEVVGGLPNTLFLGPFRYNLRSVMVALPDCHGFYTSPIDGFHSGNTFTQINKENGKPVLIMYEKEHQPMAQNYTKKSAFYERLLQASAGISSGFGKPMIAAILKVLGALPKMEKSGLIKLRGSDTSLDSFSEAYTVIDNTFPVYDDIADVAGKSMVFCRFTTASAIPPTNIPMTVSNGKFKFAGMIYRDRGISIRYFDAPWYRPIWHAGNDVTASKYDPNCHLPVLVAYTRV